MSCPAAVCSLDDLAAGQLKRIEVQRVALCLLRVGEAVHAVVVAKDGADLSVDELISHCKSLIAAYKCPRTITFVDQLPLSGAGKVLKSTLREPYWRGSKRNVS